MAGRILLAAETATHRLTLKVKLAEARHAVTVAESADDALAALTQCAPDLIILDNALGPAGGTDLCRRIKALAPVRDVPLMILADDGDARARVEALNAGADEVLGKPFDDIALMARVRSLMRARETRVETARRQGTAASFGFAEPAAGFAPQGRIALVAGQAATSRRWSTGLAALLPWPAVALTAAEALDEADRACPADVFVIEADLTRNGAGLALLSELRSRAGTRHAAMIVAHAGGDAATGAAALDLGANDLLPMDADPAELAIRARTQLRRKQEADALRQTVEDGLRLAATDPLTGLYNRRYALAYLDRVARESAASGRPFAVMVADLDHFKRVNDTFGHGAGDTVLRRVAARIRDSLRSEDLVARMGGEEFLIVMPDTDVDRARPAAERLCRAIGDRPVPLAADGRTIAVTISVGVSIARPGLPGTSLRLLMDQADAALYRAKAQGRNGVDICRPAA